MEVRACIDVDDLDKAIAFYGRALGLRPSRRFCNDWAEMVGASSAIDLLVKDSGTAPCSGSSARSYSRHWTPVHLDFVVTNLDEAVQRAAAAGAVAVLARAGSPLADSSSPPPRVRRESPAFDRESRRSPYSLHTLRS